MNLNTWKYIKAYKKKQFAYSNVYTHVLDSFKWLTTSLTPPLTSSAWVKSIICMVLIFVIYELMSTHTWIKKQKSSQP